MKIQLVRLLVAALAFLAANVSATVHYVDLNSTNPAPPYAGWSTAATNIQDAVDVSTNGDLILVTNGIYQTGGRLVSGDTTNRVAVTNQVTLQSINGPAVTVIQGYQVPSTINSNGAVRCVYLVSGATLNGFTLTGGATTQNYPYEGGGVLCPLFSSAVVSNCVITGNSAYYNAGGAEGCTLNNCTISGNQAASNGGGVLLGTLNNCIISDNSASYGGGAYQSTFNNCTITGNHAFIGGGGYNCEMNNCLVTGNVASGNSIGGGGGAFQGGLNNCTVVGNQCNSFSGGTGGGTYHSGLVNCIVYYNSSYSRASTPNYIAGSLNNCCTTPLPTNGTGNFISPPLFVNQGGGDYHLQSNSPCINSGNNAYVTTTTDLDGNPRIVGGTVDIGAYEYQTPVSMISYAWLQQYGLPINANTDSSDADGDGMNNYKEWIAGTDPTNGLSVLTMLTPAPMNSPAGLMVSWQSVSDRTYYLQRSADLSAQPAFFTIQNNIGGQPGTTTYTDTNAVGSGPYLYRVGVQ